MVAIASAVALGWALFADHLCASLEVGEGRRAELDARVAALVTELGGITTTADDDAADGRGLTVPTDPAAERQPSSTGTERGPRTWPLAHVVGFVSSSR